MKKLSKVGLITLVILLLAIIGMEVVVTKSLFVLKDKVANSQPVTVGDVKNLSDRIETLSSKIDQLESTKESRANSNFRIDELQAGMNDLRMDADAVPHGPDLIFDGEIFSLKPGNTTIIATPCGGGSGPEADAFRIRTSTTGSTLQLNKITKTEKGYNVDVTFGGYRQVIKYDPENYEYDDIVIYSGPKEEEKDQFGPIVEILRVNSDKIFVIGKRRAC
ncbi:MAG: hypothetical protein ACYC44_01255 [Patescibacteria group bacterium]